MSLLSLPAALAVDAPGALLRMMLRMNEASGRALDEVSTRRAILVVVDQLEFHILGPVEVLAAGRAVGLGRPAQRRVLLALLLEVGRPVSLDRLVDISWPDRPPPSASNLIHGYISGLRRAIEPDRGSRDPGGVVRSVGGGYLLSADAASIDAVRFEWLLDDAVKLLGEQPDRALELIGAALELWRGDALADVADEEFARADAARLEELRLVAMECRFEAALAAGHSARTLAELEAFAARYRLRERTTELLMTAMYRAGRQADALRAFSTTSTALRDELGLDPSPALQALELAVLQQSPSLGPPPRVRGNVPTPVSSFVGRARELEDVQAALSTTRLLTLTGPGGVGKTRLAIEAAAALREAFDDGTWFVDLAPVRSTSLVVQAFAKPFGVREQNDRSLVDALADYLGAKHALLIVDNCEHVVDEVSTSVAVLLRRCPSLCVLATSRESLRVDGESQFAVAPLPLGASASDAEVLFAERAAAIQPGFSLTEETAPLVGTICRRLDGLPLAIELAAPMVNVLSLRQLGTRLDDRFGLLIHGSRDVADRHHSLEAALRWSYELLTDAERLMLEALSVFRGEFTLEAAINVADVGSDDAAVIGRITHLIAKSLVTVTGATAEGRRFRLLESIREFAAGRLEDRGVLTEHRRRHALFFAEAASQAAAGFRTADAAEHLDRVAQDLDEMRAALQWSFSTGDDGAVGKRIAADLHWFWFIRGPLTEGRDWVAAALHLDDGTAAPVRMRLLCAASVNALPRGDFEQAADFAEEHLAMAAFHADELEMAEATETLGILAWIRGDYTEARRLLSSAAEMADAVGAAWSSTGELTSLGRVIAEEGAPEEARLCLDHALVRARALGEPFNLAVALDFAAELASAAGERDRAMALVDEALVHYRRVGYQEGIASALQTLAGISRRRGDVARAADLYAESLDLCVRIGAVGGVPTALEGLGWVACTSGAPDTSARLLGAAGALRARLGAPIPASSRAEHAAVVSEVRLPLGISFDACWNAAADLPLETVIVEATRVAADAVHRWRGGRSGDVS